MWQSSLSLGRLHRHPIWNHLADAIGWQAGPLLYHRKSIANRAAKTLSQRLRSTARACTIFGARYSRTYRPGDAYRARSVRCAHQGAGPTDESRAGPSSVRRRGLGRISLSMDLQHRRFRTDHRARASAAAIASNISGTQLSGVLFRATPV